MGFLPAKREGCEPRRVDRVLLVRFIGEWLNHPMLFRTQEGYDRWKQREAKYYGHLRREHPERGDLQPRVMYETYAVDMNAVSMALLEAGDF